MHDLEVGGRSDCVFFLVYNFQQGPLELRNVFHVVSNFNNRL